MRSLIAIVGPTAVGKTNVGHIVAQLYESEIISADSRQLFRETTIGTAKPSDKYLKEIKYHFINSHSVVEQYSAGDFMNDANKCINDIFSRTNVAVMVGGSGLYIDAVLYGLPKIPKISDDVRTKVINDFKIYGIEFLEEELKHVDPIVCQQLDFSNQRRVIRAVEVFRETGKPFSSFKNLREFKREYNIILIGLNLERQFLYDRINFRVEEMFENGLVEEVMKLVDYKEKSALQTVGYREVFKYLDGNITLDETIHLVKQNTRRFAKRQMTWFKKNKNISWFLPNDIKKIIEFISSKT